MLPRKLADFVCLATVFFSAIMVRSACSKDLSRSLDLSWRPLSHSPYHQQFIQSNTPAALISYANFENSNKDEIIEASKHNAQLLKKLRESHHQPITSYSDPYQMLYSQTPASRSVSSTTFFNTNALKNQHQLLDAASNKVLSRMPYLENSAHLYQTKLNYLGKPDSNLLPNHNSIHHTSVTTPKVAGYTKEHGRLNFHYHHPSFGMASSSTKRIPMFGLSVTPHPGTKIHPVVNKYQAHMALLAASQNYLQKTAHQKNFGYSPPSQIISNYAHFPYFHTGYASNQGFHSQQDNREHQQQHQPQTQQQQPQQNQQHHHPQPQHHTQQNEQHQQVLHPSIITPFLEQVQIKQKEVAAAEQKNAVKQPQDSNSNENSGSFEIINDIFSKHLVPPPPNPYSKPEKPEKLNKFNLLMQSPLQDASRFNYNNVISTATPIENYRFKPSAPDGHIYLSTEKPNVFLNLNNRTKENVYKQHKLLHPSYSGGGLKKRPQTVEKPFLPTPYKPEKSEEQPVNKYETQHSFFTIEDAVTPVLSYEIVREVPAVNDVQEEVIIKPSKKLKNEAAPFKIQISSTTASNDEVSTPRPKQKLRRRKPKPTQPIENTPETKSQEDYIQKPIRSREKFKDISPTSDQSTTKFVQYPSRTRNRTTPTAVPTSSVFTIDSSSKLTTEERRYELTTTFQPTTDLSINEKSNEQVDNLKHVKHRVRLRYKNKLRTVTGTPLDAIDFKQNINDSDISDTAQENIIVRHSEEKIGSTESSLETKSNLKLPNLKLRNEISTSLSAVTNTLGTLSLPTSTKIVELDEKNVFNKLNRPRFSIKEYKRKQISPSSTSQVTSTTPATTSTTKVDSQRFNRLRVSTRRRNETIDNNNEEVDGGRRKAQLSASTTETTTQMTTKRSSLPKRTFPHRNFTKPTPSPNEFETTNVRPITRNEQQTTTPNLRSKIQNYKRKEMLIEVADPPNLDFNTAETSESTTSTESPIKHETSIMKIAKTPSTVNVEKTTSRNLFDVSSETVKNDMDLTGSPSEHSQRVLDVNELTISGNEDYSFKSANIGPLSRRIPNYFTISTDDPILPIQAFFPQIKTNDKT